VGLPRDSTLPWLRFRFRTSLWLAARLLPWLVAKRPLDRILLLARPRNRAFVGLSADYIARQVLRTTRHPWLMRDRRCLRQGLLGQRFLAEAGFIPELHFGIDPCSLNTARVSAHCWVCLDGIPVLNDRLPGMLTILTHCDGQSSTPSYASPTAAL